MNLTAKVLAAGTGCNMTRATAWLPHISGACQAFGIDTPARMAAFLAQIGHESGRLVYVREIWGPTDAQRRYEGRSDLGNTVPGDGKRFMGRGPLQVTGRDNYGMVRDELRKVVPGVPDFVASPEALEDPRWGAMAAALFWHSNNINQYADVGDFDGVSDKVNRGRKTQAYGDSNGWPDRLALWEAAKVALAA